MNILFVAAENAPYAQVGGLSQAVSFLARAVKKQGHDVRVFMPKYGVIKTQKFPMEVDMLALSVPTTGRPKGKFPTRLVCNVLRRMDDKIFVPNYFLENLEYYELRANVYGYADEHIRFYLLSMGCLEWLLEQHRLGAWLPDIIHAHDWHTGYLVNALKTKHRYKAVLGHIKVLYTVHNFKHQGNFDFKYAPKPATGKGPLLPMFHPGMQMQNPMLRGLLSADRVNTVSLTHAMEIQTSEFGEGLQEHLKKLGRRFSGIPNGVDVKTMNPATDSHIVSRYTEKSLEKRKPNKLALQKYFKLPVDQSIPVVSYIGRLATQKGIETIFAALEHLDSFPKVQFIFLGGGDDVFRSELARLVKAHPKQIAAVLHGDFILPRKIFAGSDILLMPSTFEPGGIVAMEALRYGCVPLVADTGGLSETVQPFNPVTLTGNGFLHVRKDTWSFVVMLAAALQLYAIPAIWKHIVKNGMAGDFSWDHTALKYNQLYTELLKSK